MFQVWPPQTLSRVVYRLTERGLKALGAHRLPQAMEWVADQKSLDPPALPFLEGLVSVRADAMLPRCRLAVKDRGFSLNPGIGHSNAPQPAPAVGLYRRLGCSEPKGGPGDPGICLGTPPHPGVGLVRPAQYL